MVKRRSLFLGVAGAAVGAVGALVIGWGVMPPRQRLTTSTPLATGKDQAALNGWLKISPDNTVTVVMCKSEMGQGAHPCELGTLHVNDENLLLEIVDNDGMPCAQGVQGRVVITPFYSVPRQHLWRRFEVVI